MKYPYKKLVLPSGLKNVKNGELDKKVLKKISIGGEMWLYAAVCFNVMAAAAKKDGIKFKNIGDYRPLKRQEKMFKDRYSLKDEGRVPKVTRQYQGKTWFLKRGKSPSGVPGTSNHGLGLAIDLDVSKPQVAEWLCANAPKYGFYLQGSDPKSPEFELWHWQYCDGDKLPKAVSDAIAAFAGKS